jgi:hypothetical protein
MKEPHGGISQAITLRRRQVPEVPDTLTLILHECSKPCRLV